MLIYQDQAHLEADMGLIYQQLTISGFDLIYQVRYIIQFPAPFLPKMA
jgi:hypothetical protein